MAWRGPSFLRMVWPQPPHLSGLLLSGTEVVEGGQAGQDLLPCEAIWPAVGGKDGGVQGVVQFDKPGYPCSVEFRFFRIGQRLASFVFLDKVIDFREGQLGAIGQRLLLVGVKFFSKYPYSAPLLLGGVGAGKLSKHSTLMYMWRSSNDPPFVKDHTIFTLIAFGKTQPPQSWLGALSQPEGSCF